MKNKDDILSFTKGLASLIVFFAHFWDCFYWYSDFGKNNSGIVDIATYPPFYFFICGGFMVYVFCIISGYLACAKKITNIRQLIVAIIRRWIRFFFPVLISNLIIVIGVSMNLFPTEEASVVLENSRMPIYGAGINVVMQSFRLRSANGALWMIAPLFWGNCIIYCCTFVVGKINRRSFKIILLVGLLILLFRESVICATVSGVLLYIYWQGFDKKPGQVFSVVLLLGVVLWIGGFNSYAFRVLPRVVVTFLSGTVQYVLSAMVLCVAVRGCFEKSVDILKSPLFGFLAENSFSIFLLHVPLIYSLSIGLWMGFKPAWRYDVRFFLTLLATTCVLLGLAKLYTITIGKVCDVVTKKVDNFIERKGIEIETGIKRVFSRRI